MPTVSSPLALQAFLTLSDSAKKLDNPSVVLYIPDVDCECVHVRDKAYTLTVSFY